MGNLRVISRNKDNQPVVVFELREGGVGAYFPKRQTDEARAEQFRYKVIPDEGRPDQATSIGSGGFGAVVVAVDRLGVRRAVKLFHPLTGSRRVLAPFGGDHEATLSNKRRFKHVVDAFDSGRENDANGKEYEYAVSPFVDGFSIGAYRGKYIACRDQILSSQHLRRRAHDDAIGTITDLCAGVAEMHAANLVHMDIKPPNVLIAPREFDPVNEKQNVKLEAYLIDLGASRDLALIQSDARVPATFTVEFFPLHLVRTLNWFPDTRTCDAAALLDHWRYIDLYCCGRTLEVLFLDRVVRRRYHELAAWQETLNIQIQEATAEQLDVLSRAAEAKKESFWRNIFGDDFEVLQAIIDKLLVADPAKSFASADELLRAVQALPRLRDRGILSSDTLTDRYPRIKIRTANELVRISSPYDEIIEHPVFQRLRRVQQLSFVSEIFPDGTHTRFSHSIRTFELAKRFVWGLNRRSAFRSLFQRANVECLLASALLHDVGQYHFSHCLEDLHKMGQRQGIPELEQIDHDQVLAKRMLSEDRGSGSIRELLERANMRVADVEYIIQKDDNVSADPTLRISRDIISGIIDVDRVSYLTQDSERTGVPFGRALDLETLSEALTIRWDAAQFYEKGPNATPVGLAIEAGGISAAEAVLAGTYWMYRNVYWRHTNRAFMAAAKFAMRHVLMHTGRTFKNYIDETWGGTDLDALRWIREAFSPLTKSMNLVDPLENLHTLRRISYKRVFSLPYLPVKDLPLQVLYRELMRLASSRDEELILGQSRSLAEQMHQAVLDMAQDDEIWRSSRLYRELVLTARPELEDRIAEHIGGTLLKQKNVRKGDILVDIPLKSRLDDLDTPLYGAPATSESEVGTKKATVWIALRSPVTRKVVEWRDLKHYSRLAGEFGRAEAYNGRKVRVFFSSELLRSLEDHDKKVIEEKMQETIYEAVFRRA